MHQLHRFIEKGDLNEFEKQGLIKCFEYTYELSWNLVKDYLTHQVITGITGSRDTIRQAFHKGLIRDGEVWMQMIDDRKISVHAYQENAAESISRRIYDSHYQAFCGLHDRIKDFL